MLNGSSTPLLDCSQEEIEICRMGRQSEIERKFLVKQLPPPRKRRAPSRIDQGYFPIRSRDLEIRLRRKDSKHLITFKQGSGISRQEEEIEISRQHFRALWPLTSGARITKERYRIPWAKQIIELDVYRGALRGLVMADVEFDSVNQSRFFQPPDWFGREITGSKRYANRRLAQAQRLPFRKPSG